MKLVFLDRKTVGDDLNLEKFADFGEFVTYDFSTSEEIPQRVADADIIITNKCRIDQSTVGDDTKLKLVCVTATGTNNLDKEYLGKAGIDWRNVAGYSTETVAQHTFALLFYLYEHLAYYDDYVKEGRYVEDKMFTHFAKTFHELTGKRWGIIGLGAIGHRVAEIAEAFGCNVQYYSTSGANHDVRYAETDFETLLATSDILSIHAPLDDNTYHLIDQKTLSQMKPSAVLLNVGRGPIIVEEDLAKALENGTIAAAGIDVLDEEPMNAKNPLRRITDSTKLIITPHIAWASVEARTKLMETIYNQIAEFLQS